MTSQEKKRWLLRYRELYTEIDRSLDELSRLKSMAERVTPVITGLPRGSSGATREDTVIKIAELTREIYAKVDTYVDMRREIKDAIESLPEPRLRTIMLLRYVNGLSWEAVSAETYTSRRQVLRLHGQALENLKIFCEST